MLSFNIDDNITYNKKQNFFSKIFGDKNFIKNLLKLFLPAALQSLISIAVIYVDNFSLAGLVENQVDATNAKTALGLTSPAITFAVMVSCGWLGGVGIMMSQFFGNKQFDKTKQTLVFRMWTSFLLLLPLILVFILLPGKVISISSNLSQADGGQSWELARIYLFFSAFTFIPFALIYSLSFSLQETRRPMVSCWAAIAGMATNIILDPIFIIIFKDDVKTAVMFVALSTGFARIIQLSVLLIYLYIKKDDCLHFFKTWRISWIDVKRIFKNGISIFVNDLTYAFANMIMAICILSFNPDIQDAMTNLILIIQFTTVIWPGMSSCCSVLVGSELGKNNINNAKNNSKKLLVWGAMISITLSAILFGCSFFINQILSPAATPEMIQLSMHLEWILAPIIISQGLFSICYFSIRSGGSKIILLSDCLVMLIWSIIFASITFSGSTVGINPLLYIFLLESNQIVKMTLSLIVYKKIKWAKCLTKTEIKKIPNNVLLNEELAW